MPHQAYKFRMYPNHTQTVLLNKHFGCVRVVWNHHVQVFNALDAKKTDNPEALTSTQLRAKYAWMKEVSAAALQQKEIDFKTFKKNFFSKTRKLKLGRPKFKHKDSKQSYRLPNQKFTLHEHSIRLEKIGKVKLVVDRKLPPECKLLSVTISRNHCGHYFASIVVERVFVPKAKTGKSIGIDLGLKTFLTGSDSFKVENPKFFRESQAELKQYQQHLSRKVKGSSRYKKTRLKVAKVHLKVVNQRQHFLHQVTNTLISEYDVIGMEDLNVSGMVKNRKLSKAISDVAWAEFTRILQYKASWYGKEVVKIDRWFPSSKRCSQCGEKKETLSLKDRTFTCEACGKSLDRDLNAAHNILQEALRVKSAQRTPSEGKS